MENFISQYFKEEKTGALILLTVGVITTSTGFYFAFKLTHPTFQGIGYTLVLFGAIQLVIGSVVFFRTGKQVADLKLLYRTLPEAFKREEEKRMERVLGYFKIVKIIEIACILIGMVFIFALTKNPLWLGIGMGLLLQTGFLLVFDTIAEKRGEKYYREITGL